MTHILSKYKAFVLSKYTNRKFLQVRKFNKLNRKIDLLWQGTDSGSKNLVLIILVCENPMFACSKYVFGCIKNLTTRCFFQSLFHCFFNHNYPTVTLRIPSLFMIFFHNHNHLYLIMIGTIRIFHQKGVGYP